MKSPRVAVLLPVYNSASWLGETITALQEQSFVDYVVIAVDDSSTDGSYDLLKTTSERDRHKWYVFRNETNQGMTGNWNRCLQMQRKHFPGADYILKMDSDDVPDRTLLETAVQVLDSDRDAVLCHFRVRSSPQDSGAYASPLTAVLKRHGWSLDVNHRMPPQEAIWLMARYDNFIGSSTAVLRVRALESLAHPWFDEGLRWAADFELWTRLAALGPIRYVADVSVFYRQHPESVTSRTGRRDRRLENWIIVKRTLKNHVAMFPLARSLSLMPSVGRRWIGVGTHR